MRAIDIRVNYELGRKKNKGYFKRYTKYKTLCDIFSHLGCPSLLGFKETCNIDCSTCWKREAELEDE